MHRVRLLVLIVVALVVAGNAAAYAWYADFFSSDSSGNATYEAGLVKPEAIYDPDSDTTFIVFQGPGMDPYITAVDSAGVWDGPYRVGGNRLSGDAHGGPSLLIDGKGFLHVFFGGHNTELSHIRSAASVQDTDTASPDIEHWNTVGKIYLGSVDGSPSTTPLRATYPQPWIEPDGRIGLMYRYGGLPEATRKMDWEIAYRSVGGTWTVAETVLDATQTTTTLDPRTQWYASSYRGTNGLHVGFIRRDVRESQEDQFIRRDVYYLHRGEDGLWANAAGESVGVTRTVTVMDDVALVEDSGEQFTNQIVVREAPNGSPALLYLKGNELPEPAYVWRYQRWNDAAWQSSDVTTTDHSFDAGDFWFDATGKAHAYIVAGGAPDDQLNSEIPAEVRFGARGGDLQYWTLATGPGGWVKRSTVMVSADASVRYNNPQVVVRSAAPIAPTAATSFEPPVLFSEWNNDASSFIHKVFLFRDGSYIQKKFTPEITRLAGDNRIETAARISKEAFPEGAGAVVIASSKTYADSLCGVPLAQSYRAPVLLCDPAWMSGALDTELRRLAPSEVVILGGTVSISAAAEAQIRAALPKANFDRIDGRNRYETSSEIAAALAGRRGTPESVVLASGADFADALAASAYAARQGIPVLLSQPTTLPVSIASRITTFAPSEIIMVGGPVALSSDVEDACKRLAPSVVRWHGTNRYETAVVVVNHALEAGHTLERLVIASGTTFADAVPGGLLAARYNSVVILTKPTSLPPSSEAILKRATRVLNAYILGGPMAINADVGTAVGAVLTSVEAD